MLEALPFNVSQEVVSVTFLIMRWVDAGPTRNWPGTSGHWDVLTQSHSNRYIQLYTHCHIPRHWYWKKITVIVPFVTSVVPVEGTTGLVTWSLKSVSLGDTLFNGLCTCRGFPHSLSRRILFFLQWLLLSSYSVYCDLMFWVILDLYVST